MMRLITITLATAAILVWGGIAYVMLMNWHYGQMKLAYKAGQSVERGIGSQPISSNAIWCAKENAKHRTKTTP